MVLENYPQKWIFDFRTGGSHFWEKPWFWGTHLHTHQVPKIMVFQGKVNFFAKKSKICFCGKFLNGLRKLSAKTDFRFFVVGVTFWGKTTILIEDSFFSFIIFFFFQNRGFPPESHPHAKKSKIRLCGKFSYTI